MKTDIKIAIPKNAPLKFPCLARGIHNGTITLFVSETTGIVLKSSLQYCYIVDTIQHFPIYPLSRSDVWEIMPAGSSVTLTQE